jgi:hypothetical protein
MKTSRIMGIAALIAVIGGGPGVALSQTVSVEPAAAIQAQKAPTLPAVRDELDRVRRRLQEAKLASHLGPTPQREYIEAQREVARGEYREAMNHLNQADRELDGVPD